MEALSSPPWDPQSPIVAPKITKAVPSAHSSARTFTVTSVPPTTPSNASSATVRNIEDWIHRRRLQRSQKYHSAESYDTRQRYLSVLANEETFVSGIDQFLESDKMMKLRKKEVLYNQWNENVYIPTRRRIESTFRASYPTLDAQKRREYCNYLNYTNRVAVAGLDVISPLYDGTHLFHPEHPYYPTARTRRLKDPLHTDERKSIEEKKVEIYLDTGKLVSDAEIKKSRFPPMALGRHGVTCQSWVAVPLGYVESPTRIRSRLRRRNSSNKTTFDFKIWPETGKKEKREEQKKEIRFPAIPLSNKNAGKEEIVALSEEKSAEQTNDDVIN